jgi:hypothetical protein
MVRHAAVALLLAALPGVDARVAGQQPAAPAAPVSDRSAAAGTPAVGSICVLPHLLPEQMPYRGGDALPPTRTYAIRLDGGPWVPLSTHTPVLLAGVPHAGQHRVAIRGDGKPYTAFTFRFDVPVPRADALCLYQNDMYQTWQLHLVRQSFKACRCQGVAPSAWQPPVP